MLSKKYRLKKKTDGSKYKYVLSSYDQLGLTGYKLYVNKSDLDNFIFIDKTLRKLNKDKTIGGFFGAQKYSKIKDLGNFVTVIDD